MQDRQRTIRPFLSSLRRHWLPLGLAAFFGVALLAGSPAWAAPVTRPLNQTVPRPTPTSVFEPVPTATPRPADDDDDSGNPADDAPPGDPGAGSGPEADPSDLFPALPEVPEVPAALGNDLTATVSVTALNLREGPGTNFNVVGSLTANTVVSVTARNEDASWWYICCVPNTTTSGWASALLLNPNFDRGQAQTLLPLFGEAPPVIPTPVSTPSAAGTPQAVQVPEPLAIGFSIDPPFVWQGITATLTISVTNPNAADVVNAVLSDELPAALELVEAAANAGGTVETVMTTSGRPLLIFRWARIPAETGVSATIVVNVTEDLPPGAVIDNLVGVRARNAAYNAGAFSIGMPPLFPPVFD